MWSRNGSDDNGDTSGGAVGGSGASSSTRIFDDILAARDGRAFKLGDIVAALACLALAAVFAWGVLPSGVGGGSGAGLRDGSGAGAVEEVEDATVPGDDGAMGDAAGRAVGASDDAPDDSPDVAPVADDALDVVPATDTAPATDDAPPAFSESEASRLYAVVQNTAGFHEVLPMSADAQITVESGLGTNVIEVADGRVRCSESDCANQICVDTGWVGYEGAMVVCLPHELTVQVVADPDDAVPLI